MPNPIHIINKYERTLNGGLRTADLQNIKRILLRRGIVLLPSDTCYSLAAFPVSDDIYRKINIILNRGELPVSIAFSNFFSVEHFVEMNIEVANLLEVFTPGGITIVCKAHSNFANSDFIKDSIHVSDDTIGVRIPDSYVERDVAGCTRYPITTVAVRNKNGEIVQNFNEALEIVSEGMEKINFQNWAAIEGKNFLSQESTVVRVINSTRNYKIERQGVITKEQIDNVRNRLPSWAHEDWG